MRIFSIGRKSISYRRVRHSRTDIGPQRPNAEGFRAFPGGLKKRFLVIYYSIFVEKPPPDAARYRPFATGLNDLRLALPVIKTGFDPFGWNMLTEDAAESQSPVLSGRQSYRVLLYSRDELISFSLQNFFKDSEIAVLTAETPEDGLNLLEDEKPDVVITELCSGPDIALRFRQQIRRVNENIPVLFMTPLFYWSDIRMLDRIVEDPHSYYIPDNADRKFMVAKLSQVVSASQSEDALRHLKSRIARNWFLASLLQQAMLPPWVYFGQSYEFSCFYRPFTKVSGDLFEWLPLDEDRALFIFGDVSGHGTHSALAMTAVQSFLKQIILRDRERATHPCLIATDINDFFCNHLHNIVYMSTLIAYIDFKNNHLCYQNAGYMDLLCVDAATGEVKDINPEKRGSLPLGMVKDSVYTNDDNVEYHFSDSSAFLFFSDGLVDLSKDREGETYMDMEMCTRLASLLVSDAQKEEKSIAIPFRIYNSLEQFGYNFPQDDISLALIRKPLHLEREYVFSCRVPTDKMAIDDICERASGFVQKFYGDEDLSVKTDLLLEEYLVNVTQHGLSEYEKLNEYIAIKLCAYERELKLIVWDHGKEWNGFSLRHEKADEELSKLNDDLAESGRGIPIMTKIATQISRRRYSGLNESIFIIPVAQENK